MSRAKLCAAREKHGLAQAHAQRDRDVWAPVVAVGRRDREHLDVGDRQRRRPCPRRRSAVAGHEHVDVAADGDLPGRAARPRAGPTRWPGASGAPPAGAVPAPLLTISGSRSAPAATATVVRRPSTWLVAVKRPLRARSARAPGAPQVACRRASSRPAALARATTTGTVGPSPRRSAASRRDTSDAASDPEHGGEREQHDRAAARAHRRAARSRDAGQRRAARSPCTRRARSAPADRRPPWRTAMSEAIASPRPRRPAPAARACRRARRPAPAGPGRRRRPRCARGRRAARAVEHDRPRRRARSRWRRGSTRLREPHAVAAHEHAGRGSTSRTSQP